MKRLRGERVSFSPTQLRAFLQAAREYGAREYAAFLVGFSHGMRVSEIADLRLSDLRMSANQIQVRRLKGNEGTLQSFLTSELLT
jgi:integrase